MKKSREINNANHEFMTIQISLKIKKIEKFVKLKSSVYLRSFEKHEYF